MRNLFVLNLVICNAVCLKTSSLFISDFENVVTKVVNKHFSNLQCVCVITEKLDKLLQDLTLPQQTTRLNLEVVGSLISFESIENILKTSFEPASVGFVVQLSHPCYFLNAWKEVAKSAVHRVNPRVLLLPTSSKNNISEVIAGSELTELIVDLTMVDLIVREGPIQTLQFVTTSWDLTRKVLYTCKITECLDLAENLFPDKISDLHGKEMKVATFTYLPYAIVDPLDGTEVRIAVEYCLLHNCSISVVTDQAQWGQILDNGTGDGILGNVAEGRADLGLGALYLWYHEYQFLDFSTPYIRTGITCLAPKPELVSALFIFVRPFTLVTWVIVISVLGVAVAALFFTKKLDTIIKGGYENEHNKRHSRWFTTKADTVLRTFGFLVMQTSSNHLIEVSSIRHLVNWLHVMFLLIATSYNSGLTSIFTVPPYLPPIDSVSDLAHSGLSWGATHDAWVFSLREASQPEILTLVKRFKSLPAHQLHRLSLQEDFAFSIERLPAGHFAIGDYITVDSMKRLRLMKEDIYFEHCTIVFQKGSPFTDSFNQLIHRLLRSGLLLFWEAQVTRKFLLSTTQSAVRDSTLALYLPRYTALPIAHVHGAFLVLAAGWGVALIAFLIELYLGRWRIRRTPPKRKLKGIKKTARFTLFPKKDTTQHGFFF